MKAFRNGAWFLWVWVFGALAFSCDFFDGEFRFGKHNSRIVTVEDNPVFFWSWVGFWFLAISLGMVAAIRETKANLQRYRD